MTTSTLQHVIDALHELEQDTLLPKNIKNTVTQSLSILQSAEEIRVRVHKALAALESVSEDANIEPFTRTQLWNVVSLLEAI